ncbi:diacylglycerol kinase family protein [Quadrisphaera sp. INWT6]|uniref:diacylglycerol/lipid kinase family protein n=1 Tax=Quadrisphaera sp. INWT6 TaxID=2596917 RepID=UPI0019D6ABC4|nr:diacylglycerol kinase family protein [Quadrisphaera sp. INWT6]
MTTTETISLVVALLALVLATISTMVAVQLRRSIAERIAQRAASLERSVPDRRPLAAVVVNPTKVGDIGGVRTALDRACRDLEWREPLWLETTVAEPGTSQARRALAAGADVVVAFGGDGTVRRVASVLAGTGTPLGLVPAGTGNLLARNLDVVTSRAAEIAPDDVEAAMRVVLSGIDRRIDVGWISVERPGRPEPDAEECFLVMAGMGFDAQIMAGTPEALKAKVGPAAYFVSGLRQFNGDRVRMDITVDGVPHRRRVRTAVVGNVGRVQGGLALMPDAEVDDGYLDLLAIGPRGVVGWLDVAGRVITRRTWGDQRLAHWRGQRIDLVAEVPQEAQIDGDTIGEATAMRVRVDEQALVVRVSSRATRRPLRAKARIARALPR